jgi:hypothetical protein
VGLRIAHLGVVYHFLRKNPKRVAWLLSGILLFVAWGGVGDIYRIAIALFEHFGDKEIFSRPTYKDVFDIVCHILIPFLKPLAMLGLFLGVSGVIASLYEQHLRGSGIVTSDHLAAHKEMLMQAVEESGIEKIYSGRSSCAIRDQPYADNLCAAVRAASHIRILSLACYEFVGRREDSLLFDFLINHRHNPKIEVVLLDADKGGAAIRNRIEVLKERDATYTSEKFKRHIEHTYEVLKELACQGRDVGLWTTVMETGFRLLIADDVMFVSAYSKRKHGHEAHVFQINAKADTSWFRAFEAYFLQIQEKARRVRLT